MLFKYNSLYSIKSIKLILIKFYLILIILFINSFLFRGSTDCNEQIFIRN